MYKILQIYKVLKFQLRLFILLVLKLYSNNNHILSENMIVVGMYKKYIS